MTALPLYLWGGGLKPVTYAPLRLSAPEGMPTPIKVGDAFGHLTVRRLSDDTDAKGHRYTWECDCACGSHPVVHGNNLRSGMARSCGAGCSVSKVHRKRRRRR